MHDNATAAIELVLLQKGSQEIEPRLLELAQGVGGVGLVVEGGSASGLGGGGGEGIRLQELLAEDPRVIAERKVLRLRRDKLEAALSSITKFAPGCVAAAPKNYQ